MAKNNNKRIVSKVNYGGFEYKMSKEMANEYLKNRKGSDKNKHPQEFLCNLVNTAFGIKGSCTRVVIA